MTKVGAKKYIITIWVLLITLTFSCLGLFIANIFNGQTKNKEVSAIYTFGSTVFTKKTDSVYANNGYFYIVSMVGLRSFGESVSNGLDFSGKTVYLNDNIMSDGANFPPIGSFFNDNGKLKGSKPFCGTFDGQGHTISNITINCTSHEALNAEYLGFFAHLEDGANIKNLRLDNLSISNHNSGSDSHMGGIVGNIHGGSTHGDINIENCWISNLTITNNNENGLLGLQPTYVGGFVGSVGYASCKITNCLITNFSVVQNKSIAGFGIVNAGHIFTGAGCTETDCVANTKYVAEDGIISSSHTTTGLDYSSDSGSSGSVWYFTAEYNAGWPMLRIFMSWKTVNFGVNYSDRGSVSHASILIPSDANKKSSSSIASIVVYGQTVTATPKPGYKFSSWKADSAISYTANFEKICFYLEFKNVSGVPPICVKGTFVNAAYKTIELSGTETINVGCKYLQDKTIVFYDIGKNYRVEYYFDPKYTIVDEADYGNIQLSNTSSDAINVVNIANYYQSMKNGFRYPINNIKLTLKSYGTQFG